MTDNIMHDGDDDDGELDHISRPNVIQMFGYTLFWLGVVIGIIWLAKIVFFGG